MLSLCWKVKMEWLCHEKRIIEEEPRIGDKE